jgi:hypothetical protein
VESIFKTLEHKINSAFKDKCFASCQIFIAPNIYGMSSGKIDNFVLKQGLSPTNKTWVKISIEQTKSLLQYLISRSVFYSSVLTSDNDAKAVTEKFLSQFDVSDIVCYTNLQLDNYSNISSLGSQNFSAIGLQENYLISIGVAVLGCDYIGLFVRGEND